MLDPGPRRVAAVEPLACPASALIVRASRWGRACLWLGVVLSAAATAGWALNRFWLSAPLLMPRPVVLAAALSLLALCSTSLAARRPSPSGRAVAVARATSVIVVAVGAVTLLGYRVTLPIGIDGITTGTWSASGTGRPAPQVALVLICLGGSVLIPARWSLLRDVLMITAVATSLLGLVGHLVGVGRFVTIGDEAALPPATTVVLLVASAGMAVTTPQPSTSLLRLLADTPGGVLLRRLGPLALLLPVFGALLNETLGESGTMSDRAATWLVMSMTSVIAGVACWRTAVTIDELARRASLLERQHQELFDSIPDGIYETTIDGALVAANDPLADILGYEDAAALLAGVPHVQRLWTNPHERDELVARLVSGERSGVMDVDLRRRNGCPITVQLSYRGVFSQGRVTGLRGTIRDVTAERAAAAHLADVQERYRLAFECAPLGRAVLDLTIEAPRFLQVNEALADLLGFSVEELLDADPLGLIHPEDATMEAEVIARFLAGETNSASYDTRRPHRDGTWIPVRITCALLRDEAGQRYAMATIEDLRPRLRAAAQLVAATNIAEQRARRATSLHEVAGAIIARRDLRELDDIASTEVASALGCDITVVDEVDSSGTWHLGAHHGLDRRLVAQASDATPDDSDIVSAARSSRTQLVDDWENEHQLRPVPLLAAHGTRSSVAAPIGMSGHAVLSAVSTTARRFDADEVAFVESVANLLSIARINSATRSDLVRSERTLNALVDNAPSSVYLFDLDGRFLVANREAARVAGAPRSELLGRKRSEIAGLDPSVGASHRAHDLEVLAAGAPRTFEEHALLEDGDHTFLSVKFPLLDDDGRPFAVGGISTDITQLKRLETENRRAWNEVLRRIAAAVEYRDEETGAHTDRMAAYCELIAAKLGLDSNLVALYRAAAPLHDAGKIAIPDHILLKPGPLTPDERRIMEDHCDVGHRLLRGTGSEVLELAASIAWTHHERLDGSGYPRQLTGSEIPLEGRIAAVADVFDALISDRVYRPAHPLDAAVAILRDGRGTQFDPDVLDTLLDHLDEAVAIAQNHRARAAATRRTPPPATQAHHPRTTADRRMANRSQG